MFVMSSVSDVAAGSCRHHSMPHLVQPGDDVAPVRTVSKSTMHQNDIGLVRHFQLPQMNVVDLATAMTGVPTMAFADASCPGRSRSRAPLDGRERGLLTSAK